jgi:hypothetical protein
MFSCLIVASLICLVGFAEAEDSILVLSADEFDANLSYRERGVELTRKPTDPLAPHIIIQTPDIGADVTPPVDVAVSFQPAEGATIDLDSLKVKYGWFDITQRVLETMEVTHQGIAGKIKGMRRGRYALRVSISDNLRRTSSTKIKFEVVDPPKDHSTGE